MSTPQVPEPKSLSQTEFVAAIAAAVQAALAAHNGPNQAEVIAEAIAAGMAKNAPIRKMSYAEYTKTGRGRGPYGDGSVKMDRQYFQLGSRIMEHNVTNEEVELLNRLDRPGRYLDRLVEVIFQQDGPEEVVNIMWPCRTRDQIAHQQEKFNGLADLLRKIIAENEADDAETIRQAEAQVQKGRRPFGNNKAYREAIARRDAREQAAEERKAAKEMTV